MVAMDSIEIVSKKNGIHSAGKASPPVAEGPLVRREIGITGITPLLMNRLSEETLESIRTKAKKAKTAAKPTPREECEPKVHTREGQPALPTENLLSCLIAAGQYVRLDGKRQLSTAKSTMLPAFLSLEDPWIPVIDPETRTPATWEVDMRAGRNPNGGEAVCVCRPRFDRWTLKLTVQLDLSQIGEGVMRELFDIAGRRIGVGDFRPQRKGIFGQFRIDRWEAARR